MGYKRATLLLAVGSLLFAFYLASFSVTSAQYGSSPTQPQQCRKDPDCNNPDMFCDSNHTCQFRRVCEDDGDCPVGERCDFMTGQCRGGCTDDSQCANDEYCDTTRGRCFYRGTCSETGEDHCDISEISCTGNCPGSPPGPNCSCQSAPRCECTEFCNWGTCANTRCANYETQCDYWWSCEAEPTERPTEPPEPTDRPTQPPGGTPTPIPTLPPGATPTNTPPPEGPQCDSPCLGEDECSADQTCYFWRCRNPECPDVGADENCICPAPTSTPTPPPMQPTATPTVPPEVPTNTPPPGAPTPTPVPEASCSCLSMSADSTDLSRVKRGDVLNFTTEAYTPTPDTAEVLNMEYTVTHVDSGQIVATSGFVTAVKDRQENIDGVLVDVYKTEWSYTVKDSDPEGLYRAEANINCGWKVSALRVEVAGASTRREGFFTRLLRSISRFLTGERVETQEYEAPFPTTVRPTGTTLQLGTFLPVPTLPPSGCTWVNYQIAGER